MVHQAALRRAVQLHRAGDLAAAIAACREAARGGDPAAARLLALLLSEAGALDEACAWAARAVALQRSAENLAAQGRVLAALGRWAEAGEALREALGLQPGYAAARQLLERAEAVGAATLAEAQALFAAGRFPAAAEAFRGASLLRPGDAAALHGLGTALHEAGEPAAAIAAHRAALAIASGRIDTWHNLGSALQATGDMAGAMQAYARAFAIDPACFPRIAQEMAAGRTGQVWLSAAALRAALAATGHGRGTGRGTLPASPAPRLPPG